MKTLPSGEVLFARASSHLRLRHLRLLAAMEVKGTLGGAAADTGISQPAATQMLRELENLLEARLVERHARGVVFTDAGQVLAKFAQQTLASMRNAADALADVAAGRNTILKVGAISAAIVALVEPALPRLVTRHPRDRFNLMEVAAPDSLVAGLHAGSYDVVLVREPVKAEPNLVFEPLFEDELVIVAVPGHPAATARKPGLAMLSQYEWLLAAPQVLTRAAFDAWCRKTGFEPKPNNISGNSAMILPATLAASGAIAPTPASSVQALLRQGLLRRVRFDLQWPLPPIGGLYRRGDENARAAKFLAVLRKQAQQTKSPSP